MTEEFLSRGDTRRERKTTGEREGERKAERDKWKNVSERWRMNFPPPSPYACVHERRKSFGGEREGSGVVAREREREREREVEESREIEGEVISPSHAKRGEREREREKEEGGEFAREKSVGEREMGGGRDNLKKILEKSKKC